MDKVFLAKSSGEDLISHSKRVGEFALEIYRQSTDSNNIDTKLQKDIFEAALLHDIGKIPFHFQKMLKNGNNNNKGKGFKYRHNEVGWAFLWKYLKRNTESLNNVADGVYWHHGITNEINKSKCFIILDALSDKDISNMCDFVKELLGEDSILTIPRDTDKLSPLYYLKEKDKDKYYTYNEVKTFIRTCIISADRLASNDNYKNLLISDVVSNQVNRSVDLSHIQNNYIGERVDIQNNLLKDTENKQTVIAKAPAGFGKTIIGLLWNFQYSGKKLIWVCPRNIVADSIYSSILSELKNLSLDVSVELYLSGEVIKSNTQNLPEFSSDIIITNIDNFLNPSVNNSYSDKLFLINNADVVFDEYHELVTDVALFAGFINIMKCRNQLTTSRTLLLSATPIEMHELWSTLGRKTTILPNNDIHYPAAHNKKYKINVGSKINFIKGQNNLVILNSIYSAQEFKHINKFDKLFHSNFETEKRKKDFKELDIEYGKNSQQIIGKSDVVGTHILQASLDVSFFNLYESSLSPESTMQRIGRCDRWGSYKDIPTINIVKITNQGETKIKGKLYDTKLSNLWFSYIEKYNGQYMTLDELYVIYNSFAKENKNNIQNYVKISHGESLENFSKIFPKQWKNSSTTDVITAGNNLLRKGKNNELFTIARIYGTKDKWSSPMNTTIYNSFGEDLEEDSNQLGSILKIIKQLARENKWNLGCKNEFDKLTLDILRFKGRRSDTPYIRFDKVYHNELGLIKIEKLKKLLEIKK